MLGKRVRHRVTGVEGVVTSVAESMFRTTRVLMEYADRSGRNAEDWVDIDCVVVIGEFEPESTTSDVATVAVKLQPTFALVAARDWVRGVVATAVGRARAEAVAGSPDMPTAEAVADEVMAALAAGPPIDWDRDGAGGPARDPVAPEATGA